MRFKLIPLLLLVGTLAAPSRASRFVDLSLDQMVRRSGTIVEGDVVATRGEWSTDRTRIYTTVTLQVAEVHKGSLPGGTLELRLLGGTVDDVTMAVIGQPRFEAGERVFLFLAPNHDVRDVPFVGGEAGKLRVVADATGAEVLLGAQATLEKSEVTREIRSVLRPIGQ
jgi:hypothetical protein